LYEQRVARRNGCGHAPHASNRRISLDQAVEVLKSGKSASTVACTVGQSGADCIRILATAGDLDAAVANGPNIARLPATQRGSGSSGAATVGVTPMGVTPMGSGSRTDSGWFLPGGVRLTHAGGVDVGARGPPSVPPLAECVRLDGGDNTETSVRSRVHLFVPGAVAARYLDCRSTRSVATLQRSPPIFFSISS
jgi:hypothetical protein